MWGLALKTVFETGLVESLNQSPEFRKINQNSQIVICESVYYSRSSFNWFIYHIYMAVYLTKSDYKQHCSKSKYITIVIKILKNIKIKINAIHLACDTNVKKRHISTLELFLMGKLQHLLFAWLSLFYLTGYSSFSSNIFQTHERRQNCWERGRTHVANL